VLTAHSHLVRLLRCVNFRSIYPSNYFEAHFAACQSLTIKNIKGLFSGDNLPSYLGRDNSSKGKRGSKAAKKLLFVANKVKSAEAMKSLLRDLLHSKQGNDPKHSIQTSGGGCPLHAVDSWLSSPVAAFEGLTRLETQTVCKIDFTILSKVIAQQEDSLDRCPDCSVLLRQMQQLLAGQASPATLFESRVKEFQPKLFSSLAIGSEFPTFRLSEACSDCPEEWTSGAADGHTSPAAKATALSCQPWLAPYEGLGTRDGLCSAHQVDAPIFPLSCTALYVNPLHALCLMSQSVKTAGRRVGQTPKHTHSVKAAQCCALENIGLILLGRLEGIWRLKLRRQRAEDLALSAVMDCCVSKLQCFVTAENKKKAQQAIRAAERAASKSPTKSAAPPRQPAHQSDSASDSDDDFLAAQTDIYLKIKPHDVQSVAQQVASDVLSPQTDSHWPTGPAPASTPRRTKQQQAAAKLSAVPSVSGWNLAPTVQVPTSASSSSSPSGGESLASTFPPPPPPIEPSAAFHSGLALPSSQGAAESPFIPLSTAFSATSTVTLPGAFPASVVDMQSPIFSGVGGMLGLGSMGATSESSFAVNSALFARAEQAEVQSRQISQQAAQWAVEE